MSAPRKADSANFVNYTTQVSSDVGVVQSWPTAKEDSFASISRDALLILGQPVYEEGLPFPDTDFPPTLQRTLMRMLAEEQAGNQAAISKDEFRNALRKVAQHRQSD